MALAVSDTRPPWTRTERALIARLDTPHRVQRWLSGLRYNTAKGTLWSFRTVVRHQAAHCLEAALTAATLLDQHGYPPMLLDLESQDGLDHVLFLFRGRDGRYGTVGRSRDPGLHGRRPQFRTLRELVDSYFDPFVDHSGRIVGYASYDLRELGGYDWRLGERNRWKVERTLIDIPHRRFHGADARYDALLRRYTAYRRRYPDRKPIYYSGRRAWMPWYPR